MERFVKSRVIWAKCNFPLSQSIVLPSCGDRQGSGECRPKSSESFGKTVGAGANDIWTTDSKTFFTEEEWSKIVNLFSDTGLAKIERSRKIGKDFVRFIYLWDGVRAVLYYCQTENESDLSNYALDYSVWERIREYWWIGYVTTSEFEQMIRESVHTH